MNQKMEVFDGQPKREGRSLDNEVLNSGSHAPSKAVRTGPEICWPRLSAAEGGLLDISAVSLLPPFTCPLFFRMAALAAG